MPDRETERGFVENLASDGGPYCLTSFINIITYFYVINFIIKMIKY